MKTPSRPFSVIGPAALATLFAVGVIAGHALALPVPASVVGLALVLLGLRLGVIVAAIEEQPGVGARPFAPHADAHEPGLRAANG
jgi:hypothetical protein